MCQGCLYSFAFKIYLQEKKRKSIQIICVKIWEIKTKRKEQEEEKTCKRRKNKKQDGKKFEKE
jgi:hypothetical protein